MPVQSKKSQKEGLMKRLEGDYNKNRSGGKLFRNDLQDVKFWSCKEGPHTIDIIPYITGSMDPIGAGDDGYVLEVFVHDKVGQSDGYIICMAQTFPKASPRYRCPVCEERKRIEALGTDPDMVKKLTPGRYPRSIYNIMCYDSNEEIQKGVQIWHTSNYMMQQYLPELARKSVRPGQKADVEPFIPFMDVKEGRSIVFKREGKAEKTKYIGIRFEERNYEIGEDIQKQAKTLDGLISWPTYEQAYEEFFGVAFEDGASAISSSATSTQVTADAADPRVRKYDESAKKTEELAKKIQDEPAPAQKAKQQDLDLPPAAPTAVDNRCPGGGVFGKDIDDLKACSKCAEWKVCAKENVKLGN